MNGEALGRELLFISAPRTYLKGRALVAHTNTALEQSFPCRTTPRLPFQSGASQSELITAGIYSSRPRSVAGWPRLERGRFESRRGVPGSASLEPGLLPRPLTPHIPAPLNPSLARNGARSLGNGAGHGPGARGGRSALPAAPPER